ncbi:MAG: M48 family metallopeptidase [Spirochaetales bacterium]|nr:M48 family metallopeptidase [Spirochaetales bacterium]
MTAGFILILYLVLFGLQYIWETALLLLNMNHVRKHSTSVPGFVDAIVTPEEYRKSVDYTLTRSRFALFSETASSGFLLAIIISGSLGVVETWLKGLHIEPYTHGVLFIIIVALAFRLFGLPFSLYGQFVIEERFGFNRMTKKLFFLDMLKGLFVSLVIFVPLIYLLFFFMDRAGDFWWIAAFAAFTIIQFVLTLIYPAVIAPLFNKFTPLPEGRLRDRIFELAEKLDFRTSGIFMMDGSKRSAHSNAYFTGMGKVKRIVLFDTLIESMGEDELLSVLGHEIGHEKLRHTIKTLFLSLAGSLLGFWIISLLLNFAPFFQAFGLEGPSYHTVLVLLIFCSGPFTFFLTPLGSLLSRKYEYEADRFAVNATGNPGPFKNALLTLHRENLSNLTPHPLYSFYHYSHPTLLERIRAIDAFAEKEGIGAVRPS